MSGDGDRVSGDDSTVHNFSRMTLFGVLHPTNVSNINYKPHHFIVFNIQSRDSIAFASVSKDDAMVESIYNSIVRIVSDKRAPSMGFTCMLLQCHYDADTGRHLYTPVSQKVGEAYTRLTQKLNGADLDVLTFRPEYITHLSSLRTRVSILPHNSNRVSQSINTVNSFMDHQKGVRCETSKQENARPVFKCRETTVLKSEEMKYELMQALIREDNKLRNGREVGMVTSYHLLDKLLDDKRLSDIFSQNVELKDVLNALNVFERDLQVAQFSEQDCHKILAACLNDFLTTIDSKFIGDLGSQRVHEDDIAGQLTRDIDYGEGRCDLIQGQGYTSSTQLPTSFANNITFTVNGSHRLDEIEAIYRAAYALFDKSFIEQLFNNVFKVDSHGRFGRLLRSCTQRVVFSKHNFISAQPFSKGGKISLVMVSIIPF